jgi:pyruvate/2-oxoglutarate dehydrogenase complex dihydrolipoamide dehydrogenase (E3) component
VLIIAGGSSSIVPELPGVNGTNVVWAADAHTNGAEIGERVVVAGAGLVGCETALELAQRGKSVILIDMVPSDRIALDVHPISRTALLDLLRSTSVEIETATRLEAMTANGAVVSRGEGGVTEIPCDSIVLALGVTPRSDLAPVFGDLADEVRLIGDCRRHGGNLRRATTDGFNAAIDI